MEVKVNESLSVIIGILEIEKFLTKQILHTQGMKIFESM
jgi:hypothetical protein